MTPAVLRSLEILAMITGVGYAVLAAMRNRLCWVSGAVSSAAAAIAAGLRMLPMQSGLQVFFVGMSVYGWMSWSKASSDDELPVGTWPVRGHLVVGAVLVALTFVSAHLLATETNAAWPLLDSLTTWFSLFATWLAARAKLENWLYWIVIDLVLMYLFYVQELPFLALLNLLYIGIAAAGFVAWRRRFRAQAVPA